MNYDDYDAKIFRKSSAKSREKTRKPLLPSRKAHSSYHDVETLGQSGTFTEIIDKSNFSAEDKVSILVPSKAVAVSTPSPLQYIVCSFDCFLGLPEIV